MAESQLELVAAWEQQKEQKMSQDFQMAQQFALDNQQKLAGLEDYRLGYLQQAHAKASEGVGSHAFSQHHQFIGKLDKACELQMQNLNNARLVAEQRKAQWLQQQRKRKAVELLLEKQSLKKQKIADKQEQMLLDELSIQKFIRK